MPRKLPVSVGTKLAAAEHRALMIRAANHGLRPSEYLRHLVLTDLAPASDDRLFWAAGTETILAALRALQESKPLTPATLATLRRDAIVTASAYAESAMHIISQLRHKQTEGETDD
jgi:hypothetical protein